jgi:predicted lipoprotein
LSIKEEGTLMKIHTVLLALAVVALAGCVHTKSDAATDAAAEATAPAAAEDDEGQGGGERVGP